jgi:hypothetical protein
MARLNVKDKKSFALIVLFRFFSERLSEKLIRTSWDGSSLIGRLLSFRLSIVWLEVLIFYHEFTSIPSFEIQIFSLVQKATSHYEKNIDRQCAF